MLDDEVVARHAYFNFTVTGHSSENIDPGLAIARFCRAAEKSPHGHPSLDQFTGTSRGTVHKADTKVD